MNTIEKIVGRIIKEQELIIGPVAWEEARKVQGLKVVDMKSGAVEIQGNEGEVVDRLVAQYERLFGRASREVCKDAASHLILDLSPAQVPKSLR